MRAIIAIVLCTIIAGQPRSRRRMSAVRCRNAAVGLAMITFGSCNAASAETWSCEKRGQAGKVFTQEMTISGDHMAAPHGKGFLRVARNDDHVLVAFWRRWDSADAKTPPITEYIVIEKSTGTLIDVDDIVMSVMGEKYKDYSEPNVEVGHCTLKRP